MEKGSVLAKPVKYLQSKLGIAVLIPCYNEQQTIAKVITDFRKVLPQATIYVYDNNSTDETINYAISAGAIVCREEMQGKGNVVRRMFADIEADIYVLIDGDSTYDATSAPSLIEILLENSLDMVSGARVTEQKTAYRRGHQWGNRLLTNLVAAIFGKSLKDMLSGYRVFSRRFVKSFPVLSSGFEIETELTVHALELRMPMAEIDTTYYSRPAGSASKLSTYKDGFRILTLIITLIRKEKPLIFFGIFSVFFALTAILFAKPVFVTFWKTGLVPKLPTAVLSASLMILSFLSLTCGLILDTVTQGRKENKFLSYLSVKKNEYH